MQADRYSIMVARLKVALPLMALGLLSTLFLVSRAVDPTVAIPFADQEVQDRLKNQQITGPFFSGVSARGDQIAFVADIVTTKQGQFGANAAEDVTSKDILHLELSHACLAVTCLKNSAAFRTIKDKDGSIRIIQNN